MARKGPRTTGKLQLKLAIALGIVGTVGGLLVAVALIQNLSGSLPEDSDAGGRAWGIGLLMSVVAGACCAGGGWIFGGKIASRVTDIGLAVSKLGRGGSEVRVRNSGNDEIFGLGRSVQYLATDLAELLASQDDQGGGMLVSMDPLVKQLRDKAVPEHLPGVDGFEADGAIGSGSRGGLDYFDLVDQGEDGAVIYLVSGEGHGALAVYACRQARDEMQRALAQNATPRRALAHTNKVLKATLPSGCCARASLLQLKGGNAKFYQAGAHSPLLISQRGEVLELNAEGIAIGLDDGPVFEKSLRPQEIAMSPGTRLVLGNDAMHRCEGLLDLLRQHSPRHTNMFMNMVLGSIEQDAGEDGLREDVVILTVKKAGQE